MGLMREFNEGLKYFHRATYPSKRRNSTNQWPNIVHMDRRSRRPASNKPCPNTDGKPNDSPETVGHYIFRPYNSNMTDPNKWPQSADNHEQLHHLFGKIKKIKINPDCI